MVKGVAELQKKLTVVFPALVKRRIEEAMKVAIQEVVAEMENTAPVYAGPEIRRSDGSPIRPRALRDSIGWKWGDPPKGSISFGSVQTGLAGEGVTKISIYAGDKEAFYARWVEYGTRKWKGNPFFYRTWRNHRSRVRGRITRAIRKAIKEMGPV